MKTLLSKPLLWLAFVALFTISVQSCSDDEDDKDDTPTQQDDKDGNTDNGDSDGDGGDGGNQDSTEDQTSEDVLLTFEIPVNDGVEGERLILELGAEAEAGLKKLELFTTIDGERDLYKSLELNGETIKNWKTTFDIPEDLQQTTTVDIQAVATSSLDKITSITKKLVMRPIPVELTITANPEEAKPGQKIEFTVEASSNVEIQSARALVVTTTGDKEEVDSKESINAKTLTWQLSYEVPDDYSGSDILSFEFVMKDASREYRFRKSVTILKKLTLDAKTYNLYSEGSGKGHMFDLEQKLLRGKADPESEKDIIEAGSGAITRSWKIGEGTLSFLVRDNNFDLSNPTIGQCLKVFTTNTLEESVSDLQDGDILIYSLRGQQSNFKIVHIQEISEETNTYSFRIYE